MKNIFILFALVLAGASLKAGGQAYTGPVPKPASGYGSDGSYTVATQSFPNVNFPGHDIVVYYPSGIASPVPTLFYSHAYGGNNPGNISGFLNFAAGKGYAVVFVPYQTTGVTVSQRYSNLLDGFIKAARSYPGIIDTTRVGFVGHSFGGAAVFANSYYCFTNLNWGQNGRFLFSMAQWYIYNISQAALQSFPADVKLLSVVYENDATNDQRMANDIFNTISIPSSGKDYLRVKSDTISGYVYLADHTLPNNSAFDALDYYAYYRLLDAMCDYVFSGNTAGRDVALGNGSPGQISMPGGMHSLVHSDHPTFANPQSTYLFPCDDPSQNPRAEHCDESLGASEVSVKAQCSLFPNPANAILYIRASQQVSRIEIFNLQGQLVHTGQTTAVPVIGLASGVYFVKVSLVNGGEWLGKLIKE